MHPQRTTRRERRVGPIPNAIRIYRLQAGMTQRHLARLLGYGRKAISAWERGLSLPPVPTLLRMAKELGTLAESLYHHFYSTGPDENGPDASHS